MTEYSINWQSQSLHDDGCSATKIGDNLVVISIYIDGTIQASGASTTIFTLPITPKRLYCANLFGQNATKQVSVRINTSGNVFIKGTNYDSTAWTDILFGELVVPI